MCSRMRLDRVTAHLRGEQPRPAAGLAALAAIPSDHPHPCPTAWASCSGSSGSGNSGGGPTPLLSAADWTFWEREGYLVIPDCAPPEALERCKQDLFAQLGADPEVPDSWYEATAAGRQYQLISSQGQWDCRSAPRVHQAFAELWGDERLWVSFDGVGLRLPDRPGYDGGDGFMHVSAQLPSRLLAFVRSLKDVWLAVGPAGRAPASRA